MVRCTTTYVYHPGVDESTTPPGYDLPDAYSDIVPLEYSIATQDGSGNTLQTVTKSWIDAQQLTAEQVTTGGVTSLTTYTYPQLPMVVGEIDEYDYGSGGPGTHLRKSNRNYIFNQTDNGPAFVPCQDIVADGNGNKYSETDYYYDSDSSTAPCQSPAKPSVATATATQHDEINYGTRSTLFRGNLTKQVHLASAGPSSTTTYTYDETGQLVSSTDPCGNTTCSDVTGANHTTSYSYLDSPSGGNSQGQSNAYLTQITHPNTGVAHIESFQYNYSTGELSKSEDENSQPTTYSYSDPLLRLTDVYGPPTAPSNTSAHTHYGYVDGAAATLTTVNPIGVTTVELLDGFGRSIHTHLTTDPEGVDQVDTTYDGNGNVHSVTNPYRSSSDSTYGTTTYTFDALNRKTNQAQADGTSNQMWSYTGNIVDFYDETRRHWQRTSDALGRLTKVLEPDGSLVIGNSPTLETDYQFDALNNLKQVDQWGGPNGSSGDRRRIFSYDSLSRLLSAFNPETGTVGYSYDANGNLNTKTDARNTTTTYSYDALNRMTGKLATGINYTYGYDSAGSNGIGRLWYTRINADESETYGYDAMGRMTSSAEWLPDNTNVASTMSVAYDLAGNVTSLTYPDGRVVTQGWDAGGHLVQVAYASYNGQSVNYLYMGTIGSFVPGYWPNGSPESIFYGNGMAEGYTLNKRLQTTQTAAVRLGVAPGSYTANTSLFSHNYAYGMGTGSCPQNANNGNIMEAADVLNDNNSQYYCYDNLNRLASFHNPNSTVAETHLIDQWGNMSKSTAVASSVAFGTNNRSRLSGYGYDAAGNMTLIPNPAGGSGETLTYDAESKLIAFNGGGTYTYDAAGNRVRKDANGTWTEYVYFNGQPMAEKHADGTWSDYIYANGHRIARAEDSDIRIHMAGTNCSGCSNPNMFAGVTSLTAANGHVIQTGDVLTWRQYQDGSALGGLFLYFADNTSGNTAVDTDNQPIDADSTKGSWHVRTVSLNSFVGKTIQLIDPFDSMNAPAGNWDIYYGDIVLTSTNGSFIPIYSRSLMNLSLATAPGVSNFTAVTQQFADTTPLTTTLYYHEDQIGSARVITAGTGWPVSSYSYNPYGEGPMPDSNHYLFTGKERDQESSLDNFGARYYSSALGRFMSPDWADKPDTVPYAQLANPQTLNLYAYVNNNPLRSVDADGHSAEEDLAEQGYVLMVKQEQKNQRAQQQNGLGSSPTPPPALFQNQTDAAMNAAAGISGAVQSTGWEWGAALYKNSDGMVGITPLRTDHDPGSVGVSDYYTGKDIPAGATRIGDVHGHTGINSPDKGMHMSPGDLGNAGTMLKVHGAQTTYMVNPAGQVWKFNPATDAKPVLLPGRIQ